MKPEVVTMDAKDIDVLRIQLSTLQEVTLFKDISELATKMTALGISREIGTVNDELARFIFDADSGLVVPLESLKSEFVVYKNLFGLKIYSTATNRLELRTPGFYDMVHPELSHNSDGTLHSLYVFPQIIQKISEQQGVDLVIVKEWAKNSIFGGFDPKKGYYQTNFWEIENNDALKFADLTANGQIAFLGTHDLIAHIAGIKSSHWPLLKENASKVSSAIKNYFQNVEKPTIASLILPYTLGVVLDDLAQPPSYSSKSHIATLDLLITELEQNRVPANLKTVLAEFPASFQKIIEISRTSGIEKNPEVIQAAITNTAEEILASSLKI